MTTFLLITILLALLWVGACVFKLNQNFVEWANADARRGFTRRI